MTKIQKLTPDIVKELAFTEEELQAIKNARNREIVFDEDCPETTPERALKFKRVNPRGGTKG